MNSPDNITGPGAASDPCSRYATFDLPYQNTKYPPVATCRRKRAINNCVWRGSPVVPEITVGYYRAGQLISWPQHIGDLILPWSLGHLETWTLFPSSRAILSFTSGASHLPHVAFTLIPQTSHSYVAIIISSFGFIQCSLYCSLWPISTQVWPHRNCDFPRLPYKRSGDLLCQATNLNDLGCLFGDWLSVQSKGKVGNAGILPISIMIVVQQTTCPSV